MQKYAFFLYATNFSVFFLHKKRKFILFGLASYAKVCGKVSGEAQLTKFLPAVLGGIGTLFVQYTAKNFVKFVFHKENFNIFGFGEHSDYCLYRFVIEHYKCTGSSLLTEFEDNKFSMKSR